MLWWVRFCIVLKHQFEPSANIERKKKYFLLLFFKGSLIKSVAGEFLLKPREIHSCWFSCKLASRHSKTKYFNFFFCKLTVVSTIVLRRNFVFTSMRLSFSKCEEILSTKFSKKHNLNQIKPTVSAVKWIIFDISRRRKKRFHNQKSKKLLIECDEIGLLPFHKKKTIL